MSRVAAIQSSYVPWKGYFDVIGSVDTFVLYDDVQFSKNDWRNRNRIKTRQGTAWLTIPVQTTGRFGQLIQEVEIGDPRWAEKHWKSLQGNYARAHAWESVAPAVQALYEDAADERLLSRVNEIFIRGLCALIGLETRIRRAVDFDLPDDRNDRLVALCRQVGASEYLSGPSAKGYLDCDRFARHGISVRWISYYGYPEYGQLFCPPFVHEVTILDLLFAEGAPGARDFLLSSRSTTAV